MNFEEYKEKFVGVCKYHWNFANGEYVIVHSENANEQKEKKLFSRAWTERLMPKNYFFTCIYREENEYWDSSMRM